MGSFSVILDGSWMYLGLMYFGLAILAAGLVILWVFIAFALFAASIYLVAWLGDLIWRMVISPRSHLKSPSMIPGRPPGELSRTPAASAS
jgi:hypothetical protein